jgi:hypothetical protein
MQLGLFASERYFRRGHEGASGLGRRPGLALDIVVLRSSSGNSHYPLLSAVSGRPPAHFPPKYVASRRCAGGSRLR